MVSQIAKTMLGKRHIHRQVYQKQYAQPELHLEVEAGATESHIVEGVEAYQYHPKRGCSKHKHVEQKPQRFLPRLESAMSWCGIVRHNATVYYLTMNTRARFDLTVPQTRKRRDRERCRDRGRKNRLER